MPELRKDPVVGRWVIIATERARRPGNMVNKQQNIFDDSVLSEEDNPDRPGSDPSAAAGVRTTAAGCPFCDNKDTEIYVRKDNHDADNVPWNVRVVQSGTPLLKLNEKFRRKGKGLYDVVKGYGAHEVVIETPHHTANMADLDVEQIQRVLETYVVRFNELEKNAKVQYAIAYKNYGWAAGARRIGHARSQIIASPVNPLSAKEKLTGAKNYYLYRERCLYCDLIRQEKETPTRVVLETEHFIAVAPFAPRFLFEIWIIPKKHHCDFAKGVVGQEQDLARILKSVLLKLKVGLDDPAYNYVLQTAPFRHGDKGDRWQTIEEDYHWHIEVMPRLTQTAGFEKGTGFYICSIPPEQTVEFLKEVEV